MDVKNELVKIQVQLEQAFEVLQYFEAKLKDVETKATTAIVVILVLLCCILLSGIVLMVKLRPPLPPGNNVAVAAG